MLTCELNPANADEAYLKAVNLCFPGWGDEKQLAWVLDRAVGATVADRMMIRLDGILVAGSAVSYRWLERAGARMLVGIMTGSWTLPEARGQGCFTRIIEESMAATARAGGALLLAFVTEDNPSFRRLRDAGSALFPTTYLVGQASGSIAGLPVVDVVLDSATEAVLMSDHGDVGKWSVAYDQESWRGQLISRMRRSVGVRIGSDAFALLDRVPQGPTRLLALYPGGHDLGDVLSSLVREESLHSQGLVGFATDPSLVTAAKSAGLVTRPGFITALVASSEALAEVVGPVSAWSGRHTDLADPTNPWFLGEFAFHSGDRM